MRSRREASATGWRTTATWLLASLPIAGAPAPVPAQSPVGTRAHSGQVSASAFFGLGDGPSRILEYGARAFYVPRGPLGAYVDFRRLQGGAGVDCTQSWPGSYRCSVRAVSVGVGAVLEPFRGMPVSPVVEGGTGFLDRTDDVLEGGAALMASVAAALRVDPGGVASVKGYIRRSYVYDDSYEDVMDTTMNHWTYGLELEIHPRRP